MRANCARCDAFVRSKTTGRERRCHLYAACHKGSDRYCWVHAIEKKPMLIDNIQRDVQASDLLTSEQTSILMRELQALRARLQNLQITTR